MSWANLTTHSFLEQMCFPCPMLLQVPLLEMSSLCILKFCPPSQAQIKCYHFLHIASPVIS